MADSGFFSIGLDAFHRACNLGLNESCLYLVQACGTGKSNDETRWSVQALFNYTSITWRRGSLIQKSLLQSGLIKQTRKGKHPRFKFLTKDDDERVWLPKTFVMGAEDETPPLERIRQTGDVAVLRLVVDFYAVSNIADEGGVPRSAVLGSYERERIAEHGAFTVYGFDQDVTTCYPGHPVVSFHFPNGKDGENLFWKRLETLENLGLIYRIPVLFDSKEGEVLFPLKDPFTEEDLPGITEVVREWLPDEYDCTSECKDWMIAVPSHMANVYLADIFVLRYRQQTELTKAGYAMMKSRIEDWTQAYQTKDVLISRVHQGDIKGTSRIHQG